MPFLVPSEAQNLIGQGHPLALQVINGTSDNATPNLYGLLVSLAAECLVLLAFAGLTGVNLQQVE